MIIQIHYDLLLFLVHLIPSKLETNQHHMLLTPPHLKLLNLTTIEYRIDYLLV